MIFSYLVCSCPATAIRTAPAHQAEMSSQLLFGERAIALRQEGDWLYIECEWDQYEGWVHSGGVTTVSLKQYKKPAKSIVGTAGGKLLRPSAQTQIAPGADLFGMKHRRFYWLEHDDICYKGARKVIKSLQLSEQGVTEAAMSYLGAPYLWGGRTHMGIDCSGLVQMVFKLHNMVMPRDAAMQAGKGEEVAFLQEAKAGDLAFFDNEEGQIVHVGILLDSQRIIHASQQSGGVVIDAIDAGGIISRRLKRRTASLRIVKRYF